MDLLPVHQPVVLIFRPVNGYALAQTRVAGDGDGRDHFLAAKGHISGQCAGAGGQPRDWRRDHRLVHAGKPEPPRHQKCGAENGGVAHHHVHVAIRPHARQGRIGIAVQLPGVIRIARVKIILGAELVIYAAAPLVRIRVAGRRRIQPVHTRKDTHGIVGQRQQRFDDCQRRLIQQVGWNDVIRERLP